MSCSCSRRAASSNDSVTVADDVSIDVAVFDCFDENDPLRVTIVDDDNDKDDSRCWW